MGAVCDSCKNSGQMANEDQLRDLPAPSLDGVTSAYERFEKQTAFARIAYKAFEEKLEVACKGKDYVLLDDLADQLTTPSWLPLRKAGTPLNKLVMHPAFVSDDADPNEHRIDKTKLLLFAMLNSQGSKTPAC